MNYTKLKKLSEEDNDRLVNLLPFYSNKEIASIVGCSYNLVTARRRELGLASERLRWNDVTINQLLEKIKEGESTKAIAEFLGIKPHQVKEKIGWLRNKGIKIPNRHKFRSLDKRRKHTEEERKAKHAEYELNRYHNLPLDKKKEINRRNTELKKDRRKNDPAYRMKRSQYYYAHKQT